jgi:hypothetical protein
MLSGDYTFLTTRPGSRRMSTIHPEILKVLPHTANNPLLLNARIQYTDATPTAIYQIASWTARAGEVYSFQIGYNQISYPSQALAWKIEIYCGTYATAENVIVYYPYSYSADEVEALYYVNSLGGIDSIICAIPDQKRRDTIRSISAELNPDYMSNTKAQRQYRTIESSARTGKTLSTGYLPRLEDLHALQDLYLLDYAWIYQQVGGQDRFLPVSIEQEADWPSEQSSLQALSINYQLSIDTKAYTKIS